MTKPYCFVLMPFGTKPDGRGGSVDFDAVYAELIKPAIVAAGLEPIRADDEQTGGLIHTPMFERLLLCEYAVADLTAANANVFYELGVRHATKPHTTILIFAANGAQLPFDVGLLRALPYQLTAGKPAEVAPTRDALADRLRSARGGTVDSPVYQLINGYPAIDPALTDIFREQVQYAESIKDRLASARHAESVEAVRAVETSLGSLEDEQAGVLIDLYLSYRAVQGYQDMVRLVERMPKHLSGTILVQEQLGLAMNRLGRGEEAERILLELIKRRGPSTETYGLLGRVYKDRWLTARDGGQTVLARGLLMKAIDAYRKGFSTDWRDAYPGINALSLMEQAENLAPEQARLLPVVRFAVARKIETGEPDYWDHANLLELAVLARDPDGAVGHLGDALAALDEPWKAQTTARNLGMIRDARQARGEDATWVLEVEQALTGHG